MGKMQGKSDSQLLREYAENGSESAFTEIVARYTDLVYSAAVRQVGSPDLGRDVAQSVFSDLARKAGSLTRKMKESERLMGWLYRGTRYESLPILRAERRRVARERLAGQHLDTTSEPLPDWDRLRPVLDEVMASLDDQDRDALLLRYFKNEDLRSVGAALGVSDDAAQKRATRAREKLQTYLVRRGVTTTAAAVSTVLSTNAVQMAPAGLAATLASASLAGAGIGTATTLTLLNLMTMTKPKLAVAGAILAVGIATPMPARRDSPASPGRPCGQPRLRFQSLDLAGIFGGLGQKPIAERHDLRQFRDRFRTHDPIGVRRRHGGTEWAHETAAYQVPCGKRGAGERDALPIDRCIDRHACLIENRAAGRVDADCTGKIEPLAPTLPIADVQEREAREIGGRAQPVAAVE